MVMLAAEMEDFGRVDDSSSPTVVSCLAMAAAAKNAKVYSNTKGSTSNSLAFLMGFLFKQGREGVLVVSSLNILHAIES